MKPYIKSSILKFLRIAYNLTRIKINNTEFEFSVRRESSTSISSISAFKNFFNPFNVISWVFRENISKEISILDVDKISLLDVERAKN